MIWEYLTLTSHDGEQWEDSRQPYALISHFNVLGNEGWELCAVWVEPPYQHHTGGETHIRRAIFKRLRTEAAQ